MRGTESLGERALAGVAGTAQAGNGAGDGALRPGFTPAGVRIGRNDPCFCGSGKKFKRCHGA